jgi:hypothetical protein
MMRIYDKQAEMRAKPKSRHILDQWDNAEMRAEAGAPV